MKNKILIILFTLLLIQNVFSQKDLKIIKANSEFADIRNGKEFGKGNWKISPEISPDIFYTTAIGENLVFITDLDSITIPITELTDFDFIVLLKGKKKALTKIKYVESYLTKLKKASEYNNNDIRFIPKFTYQSNDNPSLIKIRQELKLDSIAGKGSELSKIFNLMHWVHNLVKHDGGSDNPTLKNAIDLIKICKSENRGVNCRMLATILNECYLSLNIKSRHVTCMPKETEFEDCHVINMVYSTELEKWIWIDPTFDAYVMNEKGNLLGIEEVRDRLITGQPLVLNADANWNREYLKTKEEYLENYMAKNLYRFLTPLVSEYDSETVKKDKEIVYVELLPLDGIVQTPQMEETNNKTGVKFINYKTNNPKIFWNKPE
ncbi:Transglutaminase superfamily protein [Flavobacterium sp. 9AF]|uniref:transglutaminase domain-containing protein n=1 Tax=Flavobacterium sp. 9AF TaxID=2653142 RepID=UPI0012F2AA76|nr:transglutaminase domain-containing protein [Flavobacterium sp. 9AF]VXB24660.1 Transglutaminase superfamily protein [Flavobacterium sp. 9AF]